MNLSPYADGLVRVTDPNLKTLGEIVVAFSSRIEKRSQFTGAGDALDPRERALYNLAIDRITNAVTTRDQLAARLRAARRIWEITSSVGLTEQVCAKILEEEGV